MAAPVCIFTRSAPRHSGRALGRNKHMNPHINALLRFLAAISAGLWAANALAPNDIFVKKFVLAFGVGIITLRICSLITHMVFRSRPH
jgi:hypothetical protein